MEPIKQEHSIAGAIIIFGILVAGAIYLRPLGTTPEPHNHAEVQSPETAALALAQAPSKDDHVRGAKRPKLTLIEYSDYECPFCKLQHENILRVFSEYEDDVQWIHRHFPLNIHEKARAEALAAECAAEIGGNDGFWNFSDKIFEVTPSNDGLDLATLPDLAEEVGLNRSAFEACLETAEEVHGPTIDNHTQEALLTGGNGTPWNILIDSEGNRTGFSGAFTEEGVRVAFDDYLSNE